MAQFDVSAELDSLSSDLIQATDEFPEMRARLLSAQADIVEPALKSAVASANLIKTGRLQQSIKRSQKKNGAEIRIGPKGLHHRYIRISGSGQATSGNVGYVHEYGAPRQGIRSTKWLSGTVARVSGPALNAAEAAYDEYMKKHNL